MIKNFKPFLITNESQNNNKEYFDLLVFLGYRLQPCRNGAAWETPFRSQSVNPFHFNLHGLLWSENRNYEYEKLKEWNNMMEIIDFIISNYPDKKSFFSFTTDKDKCWNQIQNAIKQ